MQQRPASRPIFARIGGSQGCILASPPSISSHIARSSPRAQRFGGSQPPEGISGLNEIYSILMMLVKFGVPVLTVSRWPGHSASCNFNSSPFFSTEVQDNPLHTHLIIKQVCHTHMIHTTLVSHLGRKWRRTNSPTRCSKLSWISSSSKEMKLVSYEPLTHPSDDRRFSSFLALDRRHSPTPTRAQFLLSASL